MVLDVTKAPSNDGETNANARDSWVKTALGQALADSVGVKEPPMTVEDSVTGCLARIDELSAETSGKFVHVRGEELDY